MQPVVDDQLEAHARMSAAGQRFMVAQAQLNYLRNKHSANNMWDADVHEAEWEWAEASSAYRQAVAEYSYPRRPK